MKAPRSRVTFGRLGLVLLGSALGLGLGEIALRCAKAIGVRPPAVQGFDEVDHVRIWALGDSHTWGWNLQRALEAMPARLQERLRQHSDGRGFQVQNFGVPGANSALIASELERRLAESPAPHAVVVLAGFNDSWNPRRPDERESTWQLVRLWRLLRLDRRDISRLESPDVVWSDGRPWLRRSDGSLEPIADDDASESLRASSEQAAAITANLEQMGALCSARGIVLVVQTYVSEQSDPFRVASATAREFSSQAGVLLADTARAVSPQERQVGSELLQPDGHPTAAGADRMARVLAEALQQHEQWPSWLQRAHAVDEPASVPAQLHLVLEPNDDTAVAARFALRGTAGAAFQVLLASRRANEAHPAAHPALGLAQDEAFAFSRSQITYGMQGQLDPEGNADATLYRAFRDRLPDGPLFAQAVLVRAGDDPIVAVSEVVELN